jgi:hypothetical protein
MLFGVREICDVVFKAKTNQKIGNKIFYKGEPVIYFDSLKTSTLEGAATTVYAQGGRGNARLVAWEGERTLTFTMEDALISPLGFMILSGAGLVEASQDKPINVHVTETVEVTDGNTIYVEQEPSVSAGSEIYVMVLENGEVTGEPYLGTYDNNQENGKYVIKLKSRADGYVVEDDAVKNTVVLVDYYTEKKSAGTSQIEITADKFGGNFYIEASTLFRTKEGVDMPAEFIIPNGKIQSNFTFTMASSGDPSTFTFTVDAFPDYTRFDKTKRVMAAIQIIAEGADTSDAKRHKTPSGDKADGFGVIVETDGPTPTAVED